MLFSCKDRFLCQEVSTLTHEDMEVNNGSEFQPLTESLLDGDGARPTNESIFNSSRRSSSRLQSKLPTRERLLCRSNARSTVAFIHIDMGYFRFIKDGFTTIVNSRWYVILLVFCLSYIVSWLLFGIFWFGAESLYQHYYNETCISHVQKSFVSAFLFSLETQVTIGYGYRFIDENCSLGVLILLLQCLIGLIIDSVMLGLVFTKLTRPRNRRKTIYFSKLAVIRTATDGKRYLEFRIVDVRRSQLVEAHVRAILYWYKEDRTGELILEQHDLDVGYDTGTDRVILLAPVIVRHPITPSSPLYSINVDNIHSQDFEIVVALEGIVESTGLTAQVLWSYTEREVLIGYKFRPMIQRKKGGKRSWEINCSLIDNVVEENEHP